MNTEINETMRILKDLASNIEGFLNIPPEAREEADSYGIIHYAKKRIAYLMELENQREEEDNDVRES